MLDHKEETVQLILNRYSTAKSRDALLYESIQSEALIQPRLIGLGSQMVQRWQSLASAYRDLGMLTDTRLPDGLIYPAEGNRPTAWRVPALLGLALLTVVSVLAWLLYNRINRRLELPLKKPKLSTIMAGLFVCLSIPVLVFILAYNYHRNSEAITETLQQEVAKTRKATIENTEAMIAGTLSLLAEMAAADPGFFRTEKSRDILYKTLTSAPEIDAAYVSFEDGYHRVVTRIDSDRRRRS